MKNIINLLTNPQSIAVVGASRHTHKVGYQVLHNIIKDGYKGEIYPVNPSAKTILKHKAYPTLTDLPKVPDIAVIITPAPLVEAIIIECQAIEVKAAIIISAGFAEVSGKGSGLQTRLLERIRKGKTRVLGPNCLGVFSTVKCLNATFGPTLPDPGNVMLISQSGAMVTAVLDWCDIHNIGLSHAITLGNRIDISENEALEFAAFDKHTKVIMAYIESFQDASQFFTLASTISPRKPIILLKGGTTKSGSKASASHTAALTSDFDLLKAFATQTGVSITDSIEDWLNAAAMASVSPSMKGEDIAIITNAGGPGVVTTDAADRSELKIAKLSKNTLDTLKKALDLQDVHNPIDILGDAAPEEFAKALAITQSDPVTDAILVLVTPQTTTYPLKTAEHIAAFASTATKPVVVCLIGGKQFEAATHVLHHHRIPVVTFPHDAVRLLKIRSYQEKNRTHIKPYPSNTKSPLSSQKKAKIDDLLSSSLDLNTAFDLLKSYDIPIPKGKIVEKITAIPQAFAMLDKPVIAKTASLDILHKAKVGGVIPRIMTATQARHAYQKLAKLSRAVLFQEMVPIDIELIIGAGVDQQIGPFVSLGLGGAYTNALEDRAFVIMPARITDVQKALDSTRAAKVLKEAGVNAKKIVNIAHTVGQIMLDFPQIKELEINPLIINSLDAIAADIKIQISARTNNIHQKQT